MILWTFLFLERKSRSFTGRRDHTADRGARQAYPLCEERERKMQDIAELKNAFWQEYESSYPSRFTEEYELLECLSRSELCETILARNRKNQKMVVGKCYCREHAYFEETEPRQMQSLECEGIPAYEGEYCNESWRCILREYVPGENLGECNRAYFTSEFICRTGIELCRILEYLHRQSAPVIHRDIKPQNVILREDGHIALIDFGIARLYGENKISDTRISGTRNFAPPEQYGFGQTDERSDIYSLGMLLTWMLTGEEQAIEKPGNFLEKVLHRCTAFSPRERYGNAGQVRRQLERHLSVLGFRYPLTVAGVAAGCLLGIGICLTGWGIRQAANGFKIGEEIHASAVSHQSGLDTSAAGLKEETDTSVIKETTDGEVIFAEPLIEQAVRLELNRPQGILTDEDLLGVTEILIRGQKVYDLKKSYYEDAQSGYLDAASWGNTVSLEDLRRMPNLKYVFVSHAKVKDVSPLADLSELRAIILNDNEIRDISALANLRNVEQLELGNNNISDISALGEMKYLRVVFLGNNPVSDISPLANCPYLDRIILAEMGEFSGEPLKNLNGISYLDISFSDTDLYEYLSGKTIHTLKLGAWDQTDLDCIRDMEQVKELYIGWSNISDISGIEGRKDITVLDMGGCVIEDLSPVFTLPNLQEVKVGVKMRTKMEELLETHEGNVHFTVEYTE